MFVGNPSIIFVGILHITHCTIQHNEQIVRSREHLNLRTHKDNMINLVVICSKLAWEPSAAKVIKSYSHRLPAYKRFNRETKFSLK